MVVMLIMSIILAAMAPVMTTRSKADSSSPWRYSPENLSDAYFGAGESQIAMIGQPNKLETDDAARLILNTSSSLPVHLSFKRDNTTVGRLQFVDTNLVLGSGSMDHLTDGSNNISIGPNNLTQVTSGGSNIAIGDSALTSTTSGTSNIGIGTTLSGNVEGNNNVAVGDDALTKANSTWNVAIGKNAYELGTGGSNTIVGGDAMSEGSGTNNVAVGTNSLWYGNGDGNVAIGANSNYRDKILTNFTNTTAIGFSSYASGDNSIALGSEVEAAGEASISIGYAAQALADRSIAIGSLADAEKEYSVAIGTSYARAPGSLAVNSTLSLGAARAEGDYSLAIGDAIASGRRGIVISAPPENSSMTSTASAEGSSSIAIGVNSHSIGSTSLAMLSGSRAEEDYSIAIGALSSASGEGSIALGRYSKAKGENNIAIGTKACSSVTGSNKVCIGANSGPSSGDSKASDNSDFIYLGTTNSNVYIPGNLIVRGNVALATESRSSIYARLRTGGAYWYSFLEMTEGDDAQTVKQSGWFRTPDTVDYGNPFLSDRRLKYVGKESSSGLDKIRLLKVYNYTFKQDKHKTSHVGVIAQDLEKVFPEAVKKGADGFLTIRMEDMFYAMINAIKELDLKYQAQETRINELEARIEKLEAKILY